MARFYITTTLPYVNADPHIGFALEIVQADIIARHHVLRGDEVFFNTGTDEHGLKIYQKAVEEKKDPQAYTDEYSAKFRQLKEKLHLYPALHFIRTSDPHHIAAAQEIWRRCRDKGDIYKKEYKGLYCVGDEVFIKEGDLVNGKCANHPNLDPIEIEEENYFFRLSAYQEKLLEYLSNENAITPSWRREEAVAFVKSGLEDFSISREKSRLSWGVPVPDDDTQTMYVWFDALTSYISTLGWPQDPESNFQKFWVEGETRQFAGKDQIRFQSIMWQAMLMSADLPNTGSINYHGFITSGGQKMSKSLGNVIDPLRIADEYGIDALRYYLARHIHPFEDSDFTMERFKDRYNADLANGLGNLVSRTLNMIEKFVPDLNRSAPDFSFSRRSTSPYEGEVSGTLGEVNSLIESLAFDQALAAIWQQISAADELIEQKKPWEIAKSGSPLDKEELERVLNSLYSTLITVNQSLAPFMPETHAKLTKLFSARPLKKPAEPLFARKD